jgi:hypothetical protein
VISRGIRSGGQAGERGHVRLRQPLSPRFNPSFELGESGDVESRKEGPRVQRDRFCGVSVYDSALEVPPVDRDGRTIEVERGRGTDENLAPQRVSQREHELLEVIPCPRRIGIRPEEREGALIADSRVAG